MANTNHNPENGEPALLFIPDISGFTKFINDAELLHSSHIISELLEIIMDAEQLGLTAAEIEGDAILYYRKGPAPSYAEIIEQTTKMFEAFQRHLLLYKRDRICQCGACESTPDLSLKFVVHYGPIITREIRHLKSLFGKEVTTAHRLMKNAIPSSEYLLLSENYLTQAEIPADKQPSWESGMQAYEGIGNVNYQFKVLTPLRKAIEALPAQRTPFHTHPKIVDRGIIRAPLEHLHSLITDVEVKSKWVFGLKTVDYDRSKIQRVGSNHACIFPMGALNLETIQHTIEDGHAEYAERVDLFMGLKDFIQLIKLNKIDDETTEMIAETYYKVEGFKARVADFFFRTTMPLANRVSLRKLRNLAEQSHLDQTVMQSAS